MKRKYMGFLKSQQLRALLNLPSSYEKAYREEFLSFRKDLSKDKGCLLSRTKKKSRYGYALTEKGKKYYKNLIKQGRKKDKRIDLLNKYGVSQYAYNQLNKQNKEIRDYLKMSIPSALGVETKETLNNKLVKVMREYSTRYPEAVIRAYGNLTNSSRTIFSIVEGIIDAYILRPLEEGKIDSLEATTEYYDRLNDFGNRIENEITLEIQRLKDFGYYG